jgi:hypothetical protein
MSANTLKTGTCSQDALNACGELFGILLAGDQGRQITLGDSRLGVDEFADQLLALDIMFTMMCEPVRECEAMRD